MENITKEAARRIAYAAHCLPQVKLHLLVTQLTKQLTLPITEEKLAQITLTDLKRLFADWPDKKLVLDIQALEKAKRYLWGKETTNPTLPIPKPYTEGDMPRSLRVAVASNTGEMLEGHFGTCLRFLIYQVGCEEVRLIEVRSTQSMSSTEDKNAARVALIHDCALLYVQSIGGPAAAKVVNASIHPVKFPQGGSAREALTQLQTILVSPPLWLAKILGVSENPLTARYLKDIEAE